MRYTLTILTLLLTLTSIAKKLPKDEDGKVVFSKTLRVAERSADEISLYASDFAKRQNLTNITIVADTGGGKLVKAHFTWPYNKGKKSCLGNMVFEADLSAHCGDREITTEIINVTYKHYSKKDPNAVKRIMDNHKYEPCDSTGTVEMLMDCRQCRGAQGKAYKMIKGKAKDYFGYFQEYIKNPESQKVNW